MIRLVGDALNRRDSAEDIAARIDAYLAQSTSRARGGAKRVFLELYGPFKTVGCGTYTNDLLELAGGANVAADATGSVVFSPERLVQADPDVILCVGDASQTRGLTSRPGMADLRAVREGRVVALNRYWLVAGPNMPESVERIRAAICGQARP
jgi:iron complex transport system substrate-binding protein